MEKQIQAIIDHFGLNNAQFAEKLGIQRSNVTHLLSGRNKPSLDLIQKILINFPTLSSDWLIFNKGEMIKGTKVEKEEKPITKPVIQESIFEAPTPSPKKKTKRVSEDKPAKKIIIFHDDHTFTEYSPNE